MFNVLRPFVLILAATLGLPSHAALAAQQASVPRYGVFQTSFIHTGVVADPHQKLAGVATFRGPGGRVRETPLFWDGGAYWKVRFSPDAEGTWSWATRSGNPGLNGRSGSFTCARSTRRGGLMQMVGSPYHFQHQDGTPFWWQGDTQWILFANLTAENLNRSTVFNYIDRRASQGFNVVHAALHAPYGGPAVDARGTPNPEYFREVDLRLAHLNARGITGGLVLAWGTRWKTFPSDAARLRFARYVAARYGAHNVYFVVANEWRDGLTATQMRRIGRELAASDPHGRLIATHSFGPSQADARVGNQGSVEEFADEEWMGFGDYQQLYDDLHGRILRARDHGKPVVNAEYGYFLRDMDGDGHIDKNNSFSPYDMRFASWDIAMAGGYFVTGFASTYYGGIRYRGPFDPFASANAPWEAQVRHLRRLFTGTGWLQWWRLRPADGLVSSPAGRSGDAIVNNPDGAFFTPPRRAHWALAEKGRQYVVYLRGYAGAHELALGTAQSATYRVLRFDPRTGAHAELGKYRGAGPVTLDPPDAQDWAYVLLKQ